MIYFRVSSPSVLANTFLYVFDLRWNDYSLLTDEGIEVSYDVESDVWQKSNEDGTYQKCTPRVAGVTQGNWSIYLAVNSSNKEIKSQKYIILHPLLEESEDRFPVVLEFRLHAELAGMDEVGVDAFNIFLNELETTIQSIRFFVPQ